MPKSIIIVFALWGIVKQTGANRHVLGVNPHRMSRPLLPDRMHTAYQEIAALRLR